MMSSFIIKLLIIAGGTLKLTKSLCLSFINIDELHRHLVKLFCTLSELPVLLSHADAAHNGSSSSHECTVISQRSSGIRIDALS